MNIHFKYYISGIWYITSYYHILSKNAYIKNWAYMLTISRSKKFAILQKLNN